jgi:hypothetical protein
MVFRNRAGMILSVSIFCIGIGAATAVNVVNGSIPQILTCFG